MSHPAQGDAAQAFDPRAITRPDPVLMRYYAISALATLIAFPIVVMPLYARYRTLRYRFDDDGISMSWGLFFKREINLTYRRIQDIHLTRNLLERWMGLAKVAIQTAAGSATPEMTIEGVLHADLLRDYLYRQMRGVRDAPPARASSEEAATRSAATAGTTRAHAGGAAPIGRADAHDEALRLLREIRDELRTYRTARSGGASGEGRP